jgi:hypothetical protein
MPQTGYGGGNTSGGGGGQNIFPARVKYVLLNEEDNSKIWEDNGKWSGIGGVKFELLNNPAPHSKVVEEMDFAKPLFPNNKILPILNELIYILGLPSTNVQNNVNDADQYYYFQPINLWNSIHHNAIPNPLQKKPGQSEDYEMTNAGLVRKISDGGTEIELGKTFKERFVAPGGSLGIPKNLQPFEGDVLYEGRWGQALRFTSTITNSKPSNPWSQNGENGDPLTIIKNLSSLYLASKQKIQIDVAAKSYKSYDTAPTSPKDYVEEQVILTSNRLLFNARKDSILLSAEKSINFNTNDTVNIDSKNKFVVDTKKIYLGSKDATEPIILGDTFLDDFKINDSFTYNCNRSRNTKCSNCRNCYSFRTTSSRYVVKNK